MGGSLLAAIIAGSIALFAPCCISVMLPAYFAGSFQNRRVLVAMTFLFAAGIATVILPLAMGASILQQIFPTQHTLIYVPAVEQPLNNLLADLQAGLVKASTGQ